MMYATETYDITTPESAEVGDYEESGFVVDGWHVDVGDKSLPVDWLGDVQHWIDSNGVEYVEIWGSEITICGQSSPDYRTGAEERRTLHLRIKAARFCERKFRAAFGLEGDSK